MIYRRYYGTRLMLRMLVVFWALMSTAGLHHRAALPGGRAGADHAADHRCAGAFLVELHDVSQPRLPGPLRRPLLDLPQPGAPWAAGDRLRHATRSAACRWRRRRRRHRSSTPASGTTSAPTAVRSVSRPVGLARSTRDRKAGRAMQPERSLERLEKMIVSGRITPDEARLVAAGRQSSTSSWRPSGLATRGSTRMPRSPTGTMSPDDADDLVGTGARWRALGCPPPHVGGTISHVSGAVSDPRLSRSSPVSLHIGADPCAGRPPGFAGVGRRSPWSLLRS